MSAFYGGWLAMARIEPSPESALADIVRHLRRLGRQYALVGGLAVSLRAEVRFTRDVDLVIAVSNDEDFERLVYELRNVGYTAVTLVEHEERRRLSTVRLASPSGIVVDLIGASSGIEEEIVERATPTAFGDLENIKVARAEELLAMKILSMTDRRLQDRIDAMNLLAMSEALNMEAVLEAAASADQ
jgi:predicted nucleotidyltransferase